MPLTPQQIQDLDKISGIDTQSYQSPGQQNLSPRMQRLTAIANEAKSGPDLEPEIQSENKPSFLSKVGDFGKSIIKSVAETSARQLTNPQSPLSPLNKFDPSGSLTKAVINKFNLPEKTNLPFYGETSVRYSDKPGTRLLQTGEDILNAYPGGGATKLTAEQLAAKGAKGTAGKLIQSAFKIGERDLQKNPNLIKDFLVERIGGLSKKSIAKKADAVVNATDTELDNIIQQAGGRAINRTQVVKALEPLKKMYENSAFADELVPVVEKKVKDFLAKGKNISVAEAQEFKKNTYALLRNRYGQLASPGDEASKQLARGIKEEIEKALPEYKVADLNKKMTIYGKARDLMERQINRTGSHELLPFKDIVLGGSGAAIGGGPLAVGGILARKVLESVPFKTYAANVLTSTKTQAVKNAAKFAAPLVNQIKNIGK